MPPPCCDWEVCPDDVRVPLRTESSMGNVSPAGVCEPEVPVNEPPLLRVVC